MADFYLKNMKPPQRIEPGRLALQSLINYLNSVDPDFDELRSDVRKLVQPPPIPARSTASPTEYWLRVISKKIGAMKAPFNQERFIMRRSRLSLGGSKAYRLRLGDELFVYAPSP